MNNNNTGSFAQIGQGIRNNIPDVQRLGIYCPPRSVPPPTYPRPGNYVADSIAQALLSRSTGTGKR